MVAFGLSVILIALLWPPKNVVPGPSLITCGGASKAADDVEPSGLTVNKKAPLGSGHNEATPEDFPGNP